MCGAFSLNVHAGTSAPKPKKSAPKVQIPAIKCEAQLAVHLQQQNKYLKSFDHKNCGLAELSYGVLELIYLSYKALEKSCPAPFATEAKSRKEELGPPMYVLMRDASFADCCWALEKFMNIFKGKPDLRSDEAELLRALEGMHSIACTKESPQTN
jgi:hypothetical protein